jgi:hypothetical protein
MRDLNLNELQFVTGAGNSPGRPSGWGCSPCPPSGRTKNNNGFGNGPESGPAPGNSGTNGSPSASDKQNNRGR